MTLAVTDLGPGALELSVHGKLRKDDYKVLGRRAEDSIEEYGAVNLLVRLADLEGVTPAALWEDLKFDVGHYADVPRLAIVAEETSGKRWMATVAKPFTRAEVAFYPETELESAREWVKHGRVDAVAEPAAAPRRHS